MRKPLATLITSALAMTVMPAFAADESDPLPFRYSLRSDWLVYQYGKDTRDCWNNGVAATCQKTPAELEGETEGRIMYDREISDNWTFKAQLGGVAFHNVGYYEHSERSLASKPASGTRPPWVSHLADTWLGFQHEDYGTVRIGSGKNPYQEAAGQTEFNSQFGGQEALDRMIAYDSPLLLGNDNTGMSLKAAMYDGTRQNKAKYEYADEDTSSAARTRGFSFVLHGKVAAKFIGKLGFYNETTGSRMFYGTGPLDGTYTGAAFQESNPNTSSYTGNGTRVTARGLALDVAYNPGAYTVGAAVAFARRLRNDGLVNSTFANEGFGTGYASDALSVYASTWTGKWSFWGKVSVADIRLTDPNMLTNASNWLYPNSTISYTSMTGEAAYAVSQNVRWVFGATKIGYDFKEFPSSPGFCTPNDSRPCYDPSGIKLYTGIRTNF